MQPAAEISRSPPHLLEIWPGLYTNPIPRAHVLCRITGSADLFAARWDAALPGSLATGRRLPAASTACPTLPRRAAYAMLVSHLASLWITECTRPSVRRW